MPTTETPKAAVDAKKRVCRIGRGAILEGSAWRRNLLPAPSSRNNQRDRDRRGQVANSVKRCWVCGLGMMPSAFGAVGLIKEMLSSEDTSHTADPIAPAHQKSADKSVRLCLFKKPKSDPGGHGRIVAKKSRLGAIILFLQACQSLCHC